MDLLCVKNDPRTRPRPTATTLATWRCKLLQPRAQPLTCPTRQNNTHKNSVELRSNCHLSARRPPRLVHEWSQMRLHAASVPQHFEAHVRLRAESAPALQDFPRRHATFVLSLLPRPSTNRRTSQPPDLGQPTLARKHAEKHQHVRRASCA